MSEETAQRLEAAQDALAERQRIADEEKRSCLRVVAEGLPAAVDAIAKRTAQAQPDVTKVLGVEGIKTLRGELAAKAEQLGSELEGATDRIKWPSSSSEWSSVSQRDIKSALFHYFYGTRADQVAAIFKRHGYDIQDDNVQRSQGLVHPHSFYSEDDFAAVAEALNLLAAAKRALAVAEKENDDNIVADIWGDS